MKNFKMKKLIKKGKKYIKKTINYLKGHKKEIRNSFLLILPFIIMDLFTRINNDINYYKFYYLAPNLFTTIYIILIFYITKCIKGITGKILYSIVFIFYFTMFIVNNVYYSITGNFFDFVMLGLASEGSAYFTDAIKNANPIIWIASLIILISFIFALKFNKKVKENNFKKLGLIFVCFVICHYLIPLTLGSANNQLEFSTWRNARNIYINFNDANKSMKITGLYEYTIRNFYITYLQTEEEISESDIEFIESTINDEETYKTKYTGKFEDKNLIFLQLEGIDDWLLTEEYMPNLYSLTKNAYNFKNHYSYYNGGGSTFNSEFAINTGFITPLSYTQNAYTFNKNTFTFSMANLFKEKGYQVNAFHMNNAEYYSRGINYKNWGYDNYYGLKDQSYYTDNSYNLDRELILNPVFNELMFPTNEKFVDYIITYSNHMPFTSEKGVCKQILNLENKDETTKKTTTKNMSEKIYSEEECILIQAKETDYFVGLLIDRLKELDLLDDTIIVAYADHYLYTVEDKTILERHKAETKNNLINHTPMFIYSKGMTKKNINEVTSQIDILPTVLNLFDMNYNPTYYLGKDALNPKYKGIVFFSDYSWYDGNVYVENGKVINNKKIKKSDLEEKNSYVSYTTEKNDKILKYDYFNRRIESNN